MNLQFNIRKAVSAASTICQAAGGKVDIICLVKMLYWADRTALLRWKRPITGDSFASLRHGPIVSRCYDLMRGKVMGEDQRQWFEVFKQRDGNTIELANPADDGPLSDREIDLLVESCEYIASFPPQDLVKRLHELLPEWKDPGYSSISIDPATILFNSGWTEDEVDGVKDELRFIDSFRAAIV